MKRKPFCFSDLMIAITSTTSNLLIILIVISFALMANSHKQQQQQQQQPNSYYLSHKILHHHHNHQVGAEDASAASPLAPISTLNLRSSGAAISPAVTYDVQRTAATGLLNQHESREGESSPPVVSSAGGDNEDLPPLAGESLHSEHDESADNYQEVPDRNMFSIDQHNSQLQAMHDLFERRQLNNHHHHQLQSSQELNPISIGLDPVVSGGPPFNLPPFPVPNHDGRPVSPHSKVMSNADSGLDQGLGGGPALPFGLNPLPHLLGFQNPPFDGPQRGDQSAHSNLRASLPAQDADSSSGSGGGSQKVWPKIFRFTDGRINLSDFERQKKIKLSSKNQHNNENHIESAPIMFDGRQLKRKSFLILHGGIFS